MKRMPLINRKSDFYRLSSYAWLLFFLLTSFSIKSQQISGKWLGYIAIEGTVDTFLYEMELTQNENIINGSSFCFTPDTSAYAIFNVLGEAQQDQFVIQEFEQVEPSDGKWCHKYLTVRLSNDENQLSGSWDATNCRPGTVVLNRFQPVVTKVVEKKVPFSMEGKWIGHLIQSDRSYGFYLEMNLEKDGQGYSFIESEGEGGHAQMSIRWHSDEKEETFNFVELEIIEKNVPDWKWCIKRGVLDFKKAENKYILEGVWKGFIEGYTEQSGACAPGQLILEKPVLTEQVVQTVRQQTQDYQNTNERKIKVQRVIEVQGDQLKLRAWDSGDVDGDIVSIFMNGQKLLSRYRVSKRKYAFRLELDKTTNFMILHADDIGEISPNTVAVSIDDGQREQMIVLSSDLEESGAVLIRKISLE